MEPYPVIFEEPLLVEEVAKTSKTIIIIDDPKSVDGSEKNENMPSKPQNERQANEKSDPDHTEGWSFLLDSARAFDEAKSDVWKSDLDNLLVFAALFSAIVTAFTVESYSWLQDDPADTSVQLLAQISLQLSSFTTGQGFVNSTAGPLPPAQPFKPERDDVTINMLWFLSLTLSLLASFFTLAVQQWLRAYTLPKQLSVRHTVRLRQSRYEALIICQVPNIILFLPVVLQAAVVLFLVGVFYLLQSLSHLIMTAFAVVAGIPFFLYAFSLVLPLMWPACPFKSPLVPATVVVLNWCLIPLAILAFAFVFIPTIIVGWTARKVFGTCVERAELDHTRELLRRMAVKLYVLFVHYLQTGLSLTMRIFGQMNDFWTAREVECQSREKEDDLIDNDQAALEWVIREVPTSRLDAIRPCLSDLPLKKRRECVLNWIVLTSGDWNPSVYYIAGAWCPMDPVFLSRVEPRTVQQYRDDLIKALPEDWESCDWVHEDQNISCILVLLTQMARQTESLDKVFIASFTKLLFKIRSAQRVEEFRPSYQSDKEYEWVHVPTACLFYVYTVEPTKFSMQETLQLISLTKACLSELVAFDPDFAERFNILFLSAELALGSTAVSLLATYAYLGTISQEDFIVLQNEVHSMLDLFDRFVSSQRRNIQFLSSLCLDHPKMTMTDCTPKALESIADSLVKLTEAVLLLPGSTSETLVQNLLTTCAKHPALERGVASLSVLYNASVPRKVSTHFDASGPVLPVLTPGHGHIEGPCVEQTVEDQIRCQDPLCHELETP